MSQVLSEFGKLIGTSANNIQAAVMPQASTVDVGTIVQYIGATNANYTNGYFYKCVSDGAVSPTYSWENIQVQEGGSGGGTFIITATPSVDPSTGAVTWTLDKTPAEVEEAYSAGLEIAIKAIMAANDATMMYLSERGVVNGTVQFYFCNTSLFEMAVGLPRLIGGWGAIVYATSDDTTWTEVHATQQILNWTQVTTLSTMGPYSDGEIVQYIGTTTSSYTNGYFYKYNATAQTWTQVDVQPSSAATFVITISGDGDTTPYTADKTPAEVEAAYAAGKMLIAHVPNEEDVSVEIPLLLRAESDGGIFFEFELCLLNPEAGDDILGGAVYGVQLVYATGGSSWAMIQGAQKDSKFVNQFTSMPIASGDYLDKVIQYIGGTTSSYTNGYFYMCVSDGSGGYSWTQLNVQPANNTSATFDITLSGDGDITPYSVDKTPDEVSAAVTAGQVVRMITSEGYLDLVQASSGSYSFAITTIGSGNRNYAKTSYVLLAGSGSTWTTIYAGYGSAKATFDITLTGDGDTTPYSVDKTPDEVVAAMTAGQVVRVITSEGPLSYIGPAGANAYSFGTTFVAANNIAQTTMVALAGTGSSWTTIIKRTYSTDSVTGKADKVSGATNGNFAALDANGNITDSGHKHSDYLTSHQDISGKADKPATATTGNFASFDANKNPVDSGKKASDFLSGTVGVANGGTGQTTLTANAVLTGNGTTAIKQVATASGALYATAANGAPTFGTLPAAQGGTGNTSLQATRNAMGLGNTTGALPVANGGTGATTFTSGAALVGAGTGAVTTRAITNNTAKTTAPAGSTNLATMNSLLYGMQNYNNRASAVNAADTNYTTYMARAIAATTTDPGAGSALTNGSILLVYE